MRYKKWKQIKIVSDGCTDERAFHETSAFLERREMGTSSCQTVLRDVFETIRNILESPRIWSIWPGLHWILYNNDEHRARKWWRQTQINKSPTGILYRNPVWTRNIPKDIASFLIYKNNSVNIPLAINYWLPGFSFPFTTWNEIIISLDLRMKIKQRDNPRRYRGQKF